jgi:uncharacterized membrane protein
MAPGRRFVRTFSTRRPFCTREDKTMDSWVAPTIAALWALFLTTHVSLSSQRLRPILVKTLGEGGFLGAYSLLALAIFIPLVWIYGTNKHAGAFLWYGSPIEWMRPIVYVAMALAFVLVIGGNLNPSPASLAPGGGLIRGVLRITRHPLFMGFGLFGLLHLCVARVNEAELAFFGGLPVVALIGCWHQDRRKLATDGESFRKFYERTSFLPFGRGDFRGLIDPPLALGIGIAATVLLRIFHPAIFGGGL